MGGFGGLLFKGIEKGGAEAVAHSPAFAAPVVESASKFTNAIADKVFGMESIMTGKSGKAITGFLKNHYEPEFDHQLSIHTQAAQAAGGQMAPHEVRTLARNTARANTSGSKDQVLSLYIKAAEKEHGQNKAQAMVDSLGIYFHEKAYPQMNAGGGSVSKLVGNLAKKGQPTHGLGFNPSKYEPPSVGENAMQKGATAALAYKAGLAHLSTPLNMLISNNLTSFTKAMGVMFGHDYAGVKAQLISTNGMGHLLHEEYQQAYRFRNGMIAKYAPGSIGEFISKNWMVPGLSAVRQRAMIAAAYQGQLVAHEAAHELEHGNPRNAIADLSWLGIDHNQLKANGYKLTPEQLRMAQFQNTQKTIFLDNSLSRSKFASTNTLGRSLMVFHGYASMQGKFIQAAIKKELFEKRDPVAAVKIIAALAVIAPNVGNFTYSLEQLVRGKDWDDPTGHFMDRERALNPFSHTKSIGDFAQMFSDNLEAFSHIAGFGVMTSYARAAGRAKLASAMLGAVPNALIEGIQDAAKMAPEGTPFIGQKNPSFKPLARDILHDIPSLGLGGILAEKYLPTAAQERARDQRPLTSKQIKARQHKRKPRS
jgi:hypothetical protein